MLSVTPTERCDGLEQKLKSWHIIAARVSAAASRRIITDPTGVHSSPPRRWAASA